MTINQEATTTSNRLLAALTDEDFRLVSPHLESIALRKAMKLELPNRRIEYIYFLDSGIASVVLARETSTVEVGIIGREGTTGLAVLHGSNSTPLTTFMQVAGSGQRIATVRLRQLIEESPSLHVTLLAYAHSFLVQVSETAGSNARGTIGARLARWLLMCHDRVDGDRLPLTHEFLALMIGAGRPGVTEAMHQLARRGLVRNARSEITVVDRGGLVSVAGEAYGCADREYERLIVGEIRRDANVSLYGNAVPSAG